MNFKKRLSILVVFIICTACGQEISGLDELKKLCEKDAGLTIYRKVEADGYYDSTRKGGTLGLLIPSNFSYTEFCNIEPNITSLFDEPGCWRLTKVSREIGLCDEDIDKILFRFDHKGYSEFRDQNCITVEKLDNPQAEYKYEIERNEWWINKHTETKMTSGVGKIVNSKTGEILGEAKNYVLKPKNSTPPSFHCGSAHVTGLQKSKPFATGLIEKTLVPRTDRSTGESK